MSCKHKWIIENGEEFCDLCGMDKPKENVKKERVRRPISQATKEKYIGRVINGFEITGLKRVYKGDKALIYADVICPRCGKEFSTYICNVTCNVIRSCGCSHKTIIGKVKRDSECLESDKKNGFIVVLCTKCETKRKLPYHVWNNNSTQLKCQRRNDVKN